MQGTINIGSTFTCPLRLVVQVPGREAYPVTLEVWADPNRPPVAGMTLPVAVDPNDPERVEVDLNHIPRTADRADAAQLEALEAIRAQERAAWLPGRASIVATQPGEPESDFTLSVRLDGEHPYQATCRQPLPQETVARIVPGSTLVAVRVDPSDHSHVALSINEPIPVVLAAEPELFDSAGRVLIHGVPCRVRVAGHNRQYLRNADGDELYVCTLAVDGAGEAEVVVPVPAVAVRLLDGGADLPAKRLPTDPTAVAIDWRSALGGAPHAIA